MKNLLLLLTLFCSLQSLWAKDFVTKEDGLRNVVSAQIDGKEVLFLSELDGQVSCYTLDGKQLWQASTDNKAVVFELVASDVNNDNKDELLVASADGAVYCFGAKGKLLWKHRPETKMMFTDLAVISNDGKKTVFAGGNDFKLYELSSEGKLLGTTKLAGTVRKIEAGHFISKEKESLFVMTYGHDKFRWEFLGFINPQTKAVERQMPYKKIGAKIWGRFMVTDLLIEDWNNDGLDDMLYLGTANACDFIAMDSNFKTIAQYSSKRKQRYAHAQGAVISGKNKQLALQYGGEFRILNTQGKVVSQTGERYKGIMYNDFDYCPQSKTLIAAGQIGGGNSIYTFDTTKKTWWAESHQLIGRMEEVEENMANLYQQAINFKAPSYQEKSDKPWMMVTSIPETKEVKKLGFNDLKLIKQFTWQENWDRSEIIAAIGEKDGKKRDRRGKYNLTHEEIVANARELEKNNQPFAMWAGHGTDPFYVSIATLEKVLEVAPNTCYGFVFAEMHDPNDPRVQHFVNVNMPRLAKAIRKENRAKMYFRYKNMFWAASVHQPIWKEMFLSGKYSDILVPCSEDTSNRLQELNLVGRVGMFAGGMVDDFGMRLVDDNPTSWRPYTPGGQTSISPYLRQGVMMAAYGARCGVLFKNSYTMQPGMNVLYALMKSGALPIVEKEDIVSIGSWHLIKDADEHLIHAIDDHHNVKQYKKGEDQSMFSVGHMHWAGANLPETDFSKTTLGVEYRWLNYMPTMPYGMVPITPIESAQELDKTNANYTIGDGQMAWNGTEKVSAKAFHSQLKETTQEGAAKMPIRVEGASWSAIQLDKSHIRVIVIDPNYIAPRNTNTKIIYQGKQPKSVTDILAKEKVSVKNECSEVVVPAGSLRIFDVAY